MWQGGLLESLLPCARITSVRFKGTVSVAACGGNTPSEYGILVEDGCFDTQDLVQLGRGRRVLQVDLLVREDERRGREGSQGALMEARQDQLLLARVGVDVADGKDARRVGGELLRVHLELLALDVQAPLGDGPQLG